MMNHPISPVCRIIDQCVTASRGLLRGCAHAGNPERAGDGTETTRPGETAARAGEEAARAGEEAVGTATPADGEHRSPGTSAQGN